MNYILFDNNNWNNLLPLTYTRPISELRTGILTIKEKWDKYLNTNCSYLTQDYLQTKFRLQIEEENILINSSLLPDIEIINTISELKSGQCLIKDGILLAIKLSAFETNNFSYNNYSCENIIEYKNTIQAITNVWDIFAKTGVELEKDFKLLTKGRKSASISKTNSVLGAENIFVEETAKIECSILNAENSYIYVGENAEIMEGGIIRGSLALCNNSVLKLGAKIYGPTTIGPHSRVGGEVNNSVIIGYSNKGHDGFLGNSVLGEWCNIGADTNNSNLKNNYAEVRLWNYQTQRFVKTGLQFCGLIMGDHSKCGINTMFNTGTVIGVSANIFGTGFPRNFVPSFSWGGASGFTEYKLNKAFEVAEKVMERRNIKFDDNEKMILEKIFEMSKKLRRN